MLYQEIFETADDAMFISQLACHSVVSMNGAASAWLGYSQEELQGRRLDELCVGLLPATLSAMRSSLADTGRAMVQTVLRCKDGRDLPVRIESKRLLAEDGSLYRSVVRDLSAPASRTVLHPPLDELTRAAIAMARVGGWKMDLRTMTPTLSEEVERIYEVEPGELLTLEQGIELYPPEARPIIEQAVGQAIAHGTTYDLELPFVTAKGRRIWIRTLGTPEIVDGLAVSLFGVFQDITERKRHELARNALNRMRHYIHRLRASDTIEQLLAPLALSLSELRVPHLRCSLVILAESDSAGSMLAFEQTTSGVWERRDLTLGQSDRLAMLLIDASDDIHLTDLSNDAQLTQGELVKTLWLHAAQSAVIAPRAHGLLALGSGQCSDYTPSDLVFIKELADMLDQASARLLELRANQAREEQLRAAQQLKSIGRLAGGVAHDFNNLLTVIRGVSDMIAFTHGAVLPPDVLEDLKTIDHASEQAGLLTRQLLAFSRRQILQPQTLDLNAMLRADERIIERLIGPSIRLTCNLDAHFPHLKFDPSQLQQVVMNLAANARDAMPGGGSLVITTSNALMQTEDAPGQEPGHYVVLSVTDTGHGMTSQTMQRMYEPFFTTKAFGRGTGLGLATVHGIVEQNGGRIVVRSEPDKGTTFEVYLPHSMEESEAKPDVVEPESRSATEVILVVDDNTMVCQLASSILREAGYTVRTATGVQEALAQLESEGALALLLTDVVMQDGTGPELAARIVKTHPDLRILYMSGYTDDALMDRGVVHEGIALLEKPFRAKALLKRVRQVLDALPVASRIP